MVDAPAWGAGPGNGVKVRVLSAAQISSLKYNGEVAKMVYATDWKSEDAGSLPALSTHGEQVKSTENTLLNFLGSTDVIGKGYFERLTQLSVKQSSERTSRFDS